MPRGLYYFNATWFGALNDFEGREKASLEEGRNAEKAAPRKNLAGSMGKMPS